MPPRHAKDFVDHLGDAGQEEEEGEADRPGHNPPLHVRGTGHRHQAQNQQPEKEPDHHARTQRPVRQEPPPAGQTDLQSEQEKAGNPRDDRQHADDDDQACESVAPAGKRTTQVKREGVVRQVRRNQARPGQRREEDREARLDVHEDREEPAVNLDELAKLRFEPLKQLHVIGEIHEAGAQERPDERQHREQDHEALLIEATPTRSAAGP